MARAKSHPIVLVRNGKKRPMSATLLDEGLRIGQTIGKNEVIPWSEITSLEITGPENLNKRITATRLVTLGVFALAAKKKTGETLVLVETEDETSSLLFQKMSEVEVKSIFAPFLRLVRNQNAQPTNSMSREEQLQEIANLHAKGLIDDKEYEAARKNILGL